ncbi:MAG: hypothetical protein A2784_03095 [Candidatus Chisholmbacteria bacterium RIFCSPHIGHO2_01_FULL_48_12]|uniref:glucose-6-phosphate isomerase n=1 Tax=Candidatus Chisholmbacteria bacterium RIFCSPHIGHO2_01_FULL_48_12 TaxID=1797589 RepID=A0A1G1VNG7_9BACT|nr:MAG: hypothetical protein A2784_03095 [Candidatus Chisholmbacteria bacterium RIFCSPHIGHO2_01_FULL_48_12]
MDFTHVPKHYAARTHEKMREVLMDPDGVGPAVHYYMIRGGKDQRNVTIWEPGTVSGEYIKTYGHYHVGDLDETYWILLGQGIAMLQKLALNSAGQMIPDVVEDLKIIPVSAGDSVYMPAGYGHLVVNTGTTYLVTADDSPVDFEDKDPVSLPGHADYNLVKRMHGFAYFIVEDNGHPTLVRNKLYKRIIKQDLGQLEIRN